MLHGTAVQYMFIKWNGKVLQKGTGKECNGTEHNEGRNTTEQNEGRNTTEQNRTGKKHFGREWNCWFVQRPFNARSIAIHVPFSLNGCHVALIQQESILTHTICDI